MAKMRFKQVAETYVGKPIFRRKNIGDPGGLEEVKWSFFDTYLIAPNTVVQAQILFQSYQGQSFQIPGGALINKTTWHTNMQKAGELPNPERLKVFAIMAELAAQVTPHDAIRFLSAALVTLKVSSKDYLNESAQRLPQAGGVFYSGYANADAAVSNGWPDAKNLYSFGQTLMIPIGQGQSFQLVADPTQAYPADAAYTPTSPFTTDVVAGVVGVAPAAPLPPGHGLTVKFHLDGIRSRLIA